MHRPMRPDCARVVARRLRCAACPPTLTPRTLLLLPPCDLAATVAAWKGCRPNLSVKSVQKRGCYFPLAHCQWRLHFGSSNLFVERGTCVARRGASGGAAMSERERRGERALTVHPQRGAIFEWSCGWEEWSCDSLGPCIVHSTRGSLCALGSLQEPLDPHPSDSEPFELQLHPLDEPPLSLLPSIMRRHHLAKLGFHTGSPFAPSPRMPAQEVAHTQCRALRPGEERDRARCKANASHLSCMGCMQCACAVASNLRSQSRRRRSRSSCCSKWIFSLFWRAISQRQQRPCESSSRCHSRRSRRRKRRSHS